MSVYTKETILTTLKEIYPGPMVTVIGKSALVLRGVKESCAVIELYQNLKCERRGIELQDLQGGFTFKMMDYDNGVTIGVETIDSVISRFKMTNSEADFEELTKLNKVLVKRGLDSEFGLTNFTLERLAKKHMGVK